MPITAMAYRPHWAIECLSVEEAEELLASAPPGSKIEIAEKEAGQLIILWVPIPDEVVDLELGA